MQLPEFQVKLIQSDFDPNNIAWPIIPGPYLRYDPPCWQNFVDHLRGINNTAFSDQMVELALTKYNAIYYRRAAYENLKGQEVLTTVPYVIFNTMEDMMEFVLTWS